MTPQEKRDTVIVSGTLGAAFLLAILAVCFVVAQLAAALHEWSISR